MLTARAEHRLSLRADNAGPRLAAFGSAWGCIGRERSIRQNAFTADVTRALDRARQEVALNRTMQAVGLPASADGRARTVLEILSTGSLTIAEAARAFPWLADLSRAVAEQLEAEALYAPYLRRQEAERRLIEREERLSIPVDLDYAHVSGLAKEMQQRLCAARPMTLGSATRVPGITPAAIAALAVHLRRADAA